MRYFLFTILIFFLPSTAWGVKRLAVLEFRGVNADEQLLGLLSDDVREGVLSVTKGQEVDSDELLVMTRENMMDMLTQMGKDASCIEGECEVELARNIGADYVISGDLAQFDELYILSIKLHETNRGTLLAREKVESSNIKDLMDGSTIAGAELSRVGFNLTGTSQQNFKTGVISKQSGHWSVEESSEHIVNFATSPSGASVYLNNQFVCSQTPCQQYVPHGTHSVRFEKQRYEKKTITLKTPDQTNIQESLSPLFGTLDFQTAPKGLSVFSGANEWGKTPFSKELDPGLYTIEIKDPCFESITYRAHVKSGNTETIDLYVPKKKAGLKIFAFEQSSATSGTVFIDGQPVGDIGQALEIPLCSKKAMIQTKSGRTWTTELKLQEKEITTVKIDLDEAAQAAGSDSTDPYDHILITGGMFVMGCIEGDHQCYNEPNRVVEIGYDFYISKAEITQAFWKETMMYNPSKNKSCGKACPVEMVSWYDALSFANVLSRKKGLEQCYEIKGFDVVFKGLECNGYRLPTEAEWEYAARGGQGYRFSGSNSSNDVSWNFGNSKNESHPVCLKDPNGYDLCDMSGNVREWVWDWGGSVSDSNISNPLGPPTGFAKVTKGGCWYTNSGQVRVSAREISPPVTRDPCIGVRLVRTAGKSSSTPIPVLPEDSTNIPVPRVPKKHPQPKSKPVPRPKPAKKKTP
ncbi:MAG: hypothetical protein CMK59_03340 [Proteobacteria bacterium]|nr:hypothetical protein [Pseudomonadota bacterium]